MSSKTFLAVGALPPGFDVAQLQIDKYTSEQVTLTHHDLLPKDQRSLVEGVLVFGLRCPVNAEFMDLYPNIRVISCIGSGTDAIDVEEAIKRGIKVGNTGREVAETVADHAFALLLASARRVVESDAICRSSPNFKKLDPKAFYGQDVFGSTIGIVGLGGIGTAVARRAVGFSMKILYHNRTRKQNLENEIGIEFCQSLTDLLKQADFVVICVSLTPQTKHMIGASELSCMKSTATLINIARDSIINQDDLVTALKTGQILAAALDVTTPEPLPRDHPLCTLPNVIITSHIGSATAVCRQNMVKKSIQNLIAGMKGEPLPSCVNIKQLKK